MQKSKIKLTIIPEYSKTILIVVLIMLILFLALPGYLASKWTWSDLPRVSGIEQLKNIGLNGLKLPDWKILLHQQVNIGSHPWSLEVFSQENQPEVHLFLLPQRYYKTHPEIEWVDVDGFEHWQKEPLETLTFVTTAGNSVQARFFKARGSQTYAIVQWYAWPGGGNSKIFAWFWRDQLAQITGNRVPWVAVNLKIIMSPLDQLESQKALAQKLAQSIQKILDQQVFTNLS